MRKNQRNFPQGIDKTLFLCYNKRMNKYSYERENNRP